MGYAGADAGTAAGYEDYFVGGGEGEASGGDGGVGSVVEGFGVGWECHLEDGLGVVVIRVGIGESVWREADID